MEWVGLEGILKLIGIKDNFHGENRIVEIFGAGCGACDAVVGPVTLGTCDRSIPEFLFHANMCSLRDWRERALIISLNLHKFIKL